MQFFTLVTLALCIAQAFANDLPACDEEIIGLIEQYWEDHETPQNVMATLAKNGRGILLYATDVLPVIVSDKNPKCIKGEFTKKKAKFIAVPKRGELDAAKATVSYKVNEADGIITEGTEGDVKKYIIFNKDGLTGFYTCNPNGEDSDAGPAIGLAVAVKKINSSKKAINEYKATLENELDVVLNKIYNKDCAN